MDEDIKEILDFLKSDECNIWEMDSLFKDEDDYKTLMKMFPEPMASMLKAIVKNVVAGLEFHNGKDSEAHEDVREKVATLDAKLRNHRHETGKTFSAKPEF